MAKTSNTENPPDVAKARKGLGMAVTISIVIHVVLALIAGAWVVSRYIQTEPPKFVAPPLPKVKIPPQTRQHRMNLAAHAGLAAKPTFKQRLVSLRPTPFALPEAPKVAMDQMMTPDPSAVASNMVSGLSGSGNGSGDGNGNGMGGSGIGKGFGLEIKFMGIKAKGRNILLLFDVSGSVVNKANASTMPLSKIKEETLAAIDKLPVDSKFGIIQFVRNYKPFKKDLVPATQPNRDLAREWVDKEWNESGQMGRGNGVFGGNPNGLPALLRVAYAMQPDVIFIISDGSFQRTGGPNGADEKKIPNEEFEVLLKELSAASAAKVSLNFVGFQMKPEDEDFWKKMARRHDGDLKVIK